MGQLTKKIHTPLKYILIRTTTQQVPPVFNGLKKTYSIFILKRQEGEDYILLIPVPLSKRKLLPH
jgi:hypothetical protein